MGPRLARRTARSTEFHFHRRWLLQHPENLVLGNFSFAGNQSEKATISPLRRHFFISFSFLSLPSAQLSSPAVVLAQKFAREKAPTSLVY